MEALTAVLAESTGGISSHSGYPHPLPAIGAFGFWVTLELEHLNRTVPHRLSTEYLDHTHSFQMRLPGHSAAISTAFLMRSRVHCASIRSEIPHTVQGRRQPLPE